MPLGDRQENDLVHITLDVWQDKVYYLGKEYPAGYFAAGVLNASDDLIVNTVREGEFLMNAYQLARIGGREELFELLPMLWDAVKKLLEALREVPPLFPLGYGRGIEKDGGNVFPESPGQAGRRSH